MKVEQANSRRRIGVFDLDGCVVDSSARLKKHVNTDALNEGNYTDYIHSFYEYGQSCEGDVAITKGIMFVQQLAAMYQVDDLVALTSRGELGRSATEAWLRHHIPWATGGDLLVMHRELHFGKAKDRSVEQYDSIIQHANSDLWGYVAGRSRSHRRKVTYAGDLWMMNVGGDDELFSPPLYKVKAMEHLMKTHDVVFAVDDHPQIIEAFDGMPFDSFRVMWAGVDCLTPAGDTRVSEAVPV